MTDLETERLLLRFPDDPPFLRALFPDYSPTDLYLGDRLRAGFSNPSLLWDIAQSYARFRQPLPDVDLPTDLSRAYRYLTDPDWTDEPMALAHMLHLPDNALEGDLIEAALMGEDLSLDEIAEIFHYPREVIGLVDQLFFNFRDRRYERLYVTQLSESIRAANSPGAEIKRLALKTRRAKLALAAAEILRAAELQTPVVTLSDQIEGELLRLAIRGLRKGLVESLGNPALALIVKYLLPFRQTQRAPELDVGLKVNQTTFRVLYDDFYERLALLRGRGKDESSATNPLRPTASENRVP